jgi:hypothetical protein
MAAGLQLPFLAETGPFFVELKCTIKRVVASVAPAFVPISIVMGESMSSSFTVTNDGALPCAFTIEQDRDDGTADGVPDARARGLSFRSEAVVDGYSSTKITVDFTPVAVSVVDCNLRLRFADEGTEDMLVRVEATAAEVPLYLAREEIDIRTCIYGCTYRDSLVTCNRGKTALKVQPKVPTELRAFMQFLPNMGFVQASRCPRCPRPMDVAAPE